MGLFRPYQPKTEAELAEAKATQAAAGKAERAAAGKAERAAAKAAAREAAAQTAAPGAAAKTGAPGDAAKTGARGAATPASAEAQGVATATAVRTADEPRADKKTITAPVKKAAPTPTRKQALAARQERLNPHLTKKEQKAKDRAAREKQRLEGMQKVNDKPVMVMIRDYVDCRWTLAEFVLPTILLAVVLPMFLGQLPTVMPIAVGVLYVGLIVDVFTMWRGLRTNIRRHFPGEPLKGKLSYAMSRAMMMRRWRQPKAAVRRGSKFAWPRPAAVAEGAPR